MHKEYDNKIILFGYKTIVKALHNTKRKVIETSKKISSFHSIYANNTYDKANKSLSIIECGETNYKFYMIIKRPGFIEDILAQDKVWEANLSYILSFFLRNGGIFIDVGANIGYHSLFLLTRRKNITCIAFEANNNAYFSLMRNVKINQLENRIHVVNKALSDSCKNILFYSQNDNEYNRGLSSINKNPDIKNYSEVTMQAITLDDFFEKEFTLKNSDNFVMKIDVQGSESQVISGANSFIRKCKPVIIFELDSAYVNNIKNTCNQLETSLLVGYHFYIIGSNLGELIPLKTLKEIDKNIEIDILALPYRLGK